MEPKDGAKPGTRRFAGGQALRQFLLIACLLWVYVTVSNLRCGARLRSGLARLTPFSLFAEWDARLLQHLFLLPMLRVSFWASLRVQWRPLLVALPLQLILGGAFAAIAYPAPVLASAVLGRGGLHGPVMLQLYTLNGPFFLNLWLASCLDVLPACGLGLALLAGLELYTRFFNSKLRISRSCLVNMNFVEDVNRTLRGDFILSFAGGATVTGSEGFRPKAKGYLGTLRL